MNTKQIQFNRHKVAALLLAGLILAAGLAWTGAVEPAKRMQAGLYFPPSDYTGPSASGDYPTVVKGSKVGGSTEGVSLLDGESEVLPWSQLRFVKGRKPGASGGAGTTASQ